MTRRTKTEVSFTQTATKVVATVREVFVDSGRTKRIKLVLDKHAPVQQGPGFADCKAELITQLQGAGYWPKS